jgi:AraC family transcriptional regulator of adaptative response/methylated-DNA-[protein]-cysteine methyltransferase
MIGGATEQGVCLLEWHDRGGVETILKRVEKRYKTEVTRGTNEHLSTMATELERYFAGELKRFETKIDVAGTPFERSVWCELLKINYGTTRSYGEIASHVNKPGAARAVGRANGANYLAILIPCHRVIEANGNLRGYGGGLWRKKYLLQLETGERSFDLPPAISSTQLKR